MNVPLLNDEQRHRIGITYKEQGRDAAVLLGFDLVGPRFGELVRSARALAGSQRDVQVYCWRGGMRSQILGWVLQLAGFRVRILPGGYKAWRNNLLLRCGEPRKLIVLGGRTGSGKTELLHHLAAQGEQVIDLEGLAHHKGSAFGALGEPPQPSHEQFENLVALAWCNTDPERAVWMENESRSIGRVKLPDAVYNHLRNAPVVEAVVPIDVRKQRILETYGTFSAKELSDCTRQLAKRLGGLRLQEAMSALEEDRRDEWLDILLGYYDKTYDYGNSQRLQSSIHPLELSPGESHAAFADRLADHVKKLIL